MTAGGGPPTGQVRLEIPARAQYLHVVRSVVAAAVSVDHRIPPARVADLRIAVSEAATNAVEAHTEAGADERIVVRCTLDDEQVVVEIADRGSGFDAGGLPPLPAAGDPARLMHESGLGVPLMQELTDEAEIRSGAGGTTVRLVVRVPPARRGEGATGV
jgi:serine/threonine-protein kinase RsbW